MRQQSITPSITVTIGRHTRIYYAFVTSAPAELDAPSTMTLYAATFADVVGFAADPITHDRVSDLAPNCASERKDQLDVAVGDDEPARVPRRRRTTLVRVDPRDDPAQFLTRRIEADAHGAVGCCRGRNLTIRAHGHGPSLYE